MHGYNKGLTINYARELATQARAVKRTRTKVMGKGQSRVRVKEPRVKARVKLRPVTVASSRA